MTINRAILLTSILSILVAGCSQTPSTSTNLAEIASTTLIKPVVVTDTVAFDSDDPAIWINSADPAKSLVVGTDKNEEGALYVFDLNGKIIEDKVVRGLKRPNNVDIEYGLTLNGKPVDIAVVTERMTHKLRIFSVPDLRPVDNGGLEMFAGDTTSGYRDLMGISIYKNQKTNKIYAIVGRKSGPAAGYLGQYLLEDDGKGVVKASLVRTFGNYSGKKEIESIAVDDELGYVYYSDEGVGVRKYNVDPEKGNEELALFATTGFTEDHEGISIYNLENGKGYILVSDQGANKFHVFPREGSTTNPHEHTLIKVLDLSTMESDGSDVTSTSLPAPFTSGLFVAMSTDKTFQFYRWEDLAGKDLAIAPHDIASVEKSVKR